jgi:hypothetical protein
MIASIVYLLCAATALACSLLLFRGYRRSGARLLLWSALCFFGLFINNGLLYIDLVLVPNAIDLSLARNITALVSVSILVYGLIWDAR